MLNYRFHPRVQRCIASVQRGGVIAYPTESVWGLGCDPFNRHAITKVLQLKKRSASKGLILVAANMAQIDWLLEGLSSSQHKVLQQSWPGHTTWLLPHNGRVPQNVCGSHDTIAVRVSAHPVVRALCEGVGGPLVSTSANPQGLPAAKNSTDVRRYFGKQALTLCAGCVGRYPSPSVIKDLRTSRIIRA